MTICEPQSGGEILCIRLSGLGDVVHAMNALSLLRERRPNARVTWVVEERFADLLENHPHIDELLTIPRYAWGRLLKNPLHWGRVLPELTDLVLHLRRHEFDVSLDFQSSLKSAWLTSAAGADLRVGFAPPVSRELSHHVQHELVHVPETGCHRIERNLALLGALGVPTRYKAPLLPCEDEYAETVEWVCEDLPRPLVLMHPGTSDFASFKRWVPERYGHVADRLMTEWGAGVLVTFGPGEEALAHRLVASSAHRAVLAPRLAHLQQLTYLLGQADLFIGSDTGPMHLASALGVPVVALFGPKNPVETGPYCSRSEVVFAPVDCRPCTRRRCDDRRCMTEISAEQVFDAADRLLRGGGSCRGEETEIVRGPFTAGFKLGQWRGEVATSYSEPEFFRFASGLISAGNMQAHGGEVKAHYEGTSGRNLVIRSMKRTPFRERGVAGLVQNGGLGNFWRRAVEMRWAGLPVPYPVCYLQSGGQQYLIMEDDGECADVRDALVRGGNSQLDQNLAGLLQRMHCAGYYHGGLERRCSVAVTANGRLHVDHLERALHLRLPLLLREVAAGLDLHGFLAGIDIETGGRIRDAMRCYVCDADRGMVARHVLSWAIGGSLLE
jgi:lipopolysaccharide heptosyltransferase I